MLCFEVLSVGQVTGEVDEITCSPCNEPGRKLVLVLRRQSCHWEHNDAAALTDTVIHPRDVVAVLRPSENTESGDRIVVVMRYFYHIQERKRFIGCISWSTSLPHEPTKTPEVPDLYFSIDWATLFSLITKTGATRCDIAKIELRRPHPGPRGFEKRSVPPVCGALQTRELYVVYHFLVFIDVFTYRIGHYNSSRKGGEGFYIQPLAGSAKSRKSTSFSRIISAISPGVPVSDVFDRLIDDITNEMPTGRAIITGNGVRRRVFLDAVGLFGDTPGLNALLDVYGHRGLSCCHECYYFAGENAVMHNRYLTKSVGWIQTTVRRTPVWQAAGRSMHPSPVLLQRYVIRKLGTG